MNFSQIKCFLAAADCLSFTKAAERLYLSQPVLSRQIAHGKEKLAKGVLKRSDFVEFLQNICYNLSTTVNRTGVLVVRRGLLKGNAVRYRGSPRYRKDVVRRNRPLRAFRVREGAADRRNRVPHRPSRETCPYV